MRGLINRLGRTFVAVVVMAMLAVPVQAKPIDDAWSPSKLLEAVERFVVRTLGDGILVPRP